MRTLQINEELITEAQWQKLLKGKTITLKRIGKVRWPVGCIMNADKFFLRNGFVRLEKIV